MSDLWWVGIDQLDSDQQKIYSLPFGGSHLILGPPGSGKTNLLLLRANYTFLAKQPNIIIPVFTRTLREFIASGGQQYDFPLSKLMTCRKWATDFLYSYGVKVLLPGTFDDDRHVLIGEVGNLIDSLKIGPIFDAIFLDEAQDYLPEEIVVFKRLSKVLFAVADSHQKIYPGDDPIDTLRKSVDEVHELTFHYRNGEKICKLADALGGDAGDYRPILSTSNYDEKARPSSVEFIPCKDLTQQLGIVIDRLKLQLKAYPDEMLGVITPRNEEVDKVWQSIQQSELKDSAMLQGRGEHESFDPSKRICVSSLHGAKGLEFRALHVVGLEFLKKFKLQRKMAYTAVTRAKSSLNMYAAEEIPGYFEQALTSLNPAPIELPDPDSVFGRKKKAR